MNYTDWKQVRLVDLALINAKSISGKYPYEEIEYIDTSSITRNEFSPLQRLKLIDAPSRAKRIVQHGDTIISTVRPIQRHFGFIRNPKANTIASTGFAVITPRSVNPEFLYYYLSQDSITNYLNGIAETSTTTFPAFRPEVLSDLEMVIPSDEKVQRRIAEILSTLDDKIELNRQTNATLESIAQAIFKEWFVDFNFPGATGEMVESELGMIPKGWRVGKLGNEGDFKNGVNYSRNEIGDSEFYIVNVRDVTESKFIEKNRLNKIRIDRKKAYPYLLESDDILIVRSASPGETAILLQPESGIIYSGFTIRFRLINKNYFLYLFFIYQNIKNILNNLANGTTLKNVNQEMLKAYQVVIPDEKVIIAFNHQIKSIYEIIQNNNKEIATLAAIRDALLPKLMNGEIEV